GRLDSFRGPNVCVNDRHFLSRRFRLGAEGGQPRKWPASVCGGADHHDLTWARNICGLESDRLMLRACLRIQLVFQRYVDRTSGWADLLGCWEKFGSACGVAEHLAEPKVVDDR